MKRFTGLMIISMGMLYPFTHVVAQSYTEGALLFSRTFQGGTARIQGMGSAQVSLGGDPSLAGSNPAGLGMSNRSSFTITGNLFSEMTNSRYYNENSSDYLNKFNLPQLGIIFHNPASDEEDEYKGGAFSVNFSMINNYHHQLNYEARPDNSIIDYLLSAVDGLSPSAFGENGSEANSLTGLGWYTYLIDTIGGYYDSYILDYPDHQGETIRQRGNHYKWDFSYGGNFDDKIFIGGGLSISNFKYFSEKSFYEVFPPNEITSIEVDENLFISGSGISAVVGIIGRPVDFLQLGFSYRTPTLYNVNDEYDAVIRAHWNNFNYGGNEILGTVTDQSDILYSDYSIKSPGKLSFGATGFIGKYGFVTADFERVNYAAIRLNSRDISFKGDNELISSTHKTSNNFRMGGELRYKALRFRAGGALYGDPYKNNTLVNADIRQVTLGAGFRKESFSIDLALVNTTYESAYFPYLINGEGHMVNTKTNQLNTMVTVGFNF